MNIYTMWERELNAFDIWLNASPDAEPMAGDELT